MAFFDDDETCTRLKDALDIRELRDPDGPGVDFEVDRDHLFNAEEELDNDVRCFDKTLLASNICVLSDEEDEDDGDGEDDSEYLTEIERMRKKMLRMKNSDVTPCKDGGVLKQLKTPGIGGVIPDGALVKIHYNAYTDVGQAPYDSTRLRNEVHKLRLGRAENIVGLELAVASMKKHEVSRFLISPDYGYGKFGCPPRIPGNATLIFDIEVLHFVEQEGVDDYYALTPEERRAKLKYVDIEKVVKAENAEAKEYFCNKNFSKAFGKYKKAANILESYHMKNEEEEKQWEKQLLRVYINIAICSFHLNHFGRCISYCNLALKMDKNCSKAHYFKGKSLHSLGSFEDAKASLTKARNLEPSDVLVAKAMQALAKSMKEHKVFETNMCRRMFATSSSGEGAGPSSTNQKPEEKEKEGASSGGCSERFKALVKEQFDKFKADASMTEMSFPKIQLTPAEIECILETALSLGMDVRQKGTGNSLQFEVYKKPSKM